MTNYDLPNLRVAQKFTQPLTYVSFGSKVSHNATARQSVKLKEFSTDDDIKSQLILARSQTLMNHKSAMSMTMMMTILMIKKQRRPSQFMNSTIKLMRCQCSSKTWTVTTLSNISSYTTVAWMIDVYNKPLVVLAVSSSMKMQWSYNMICRWRVLVWCNKILQLSLDEE